MTGLSHVYAAFCAASSGYRDLFVRKGVRPERIEVTGATLRSVRCGRCQWMNPMHRGSAMNQFLQRSLASFESPEEAGGAEASFRASVNRRINSLRAG
jgi:hypothetical protein